MNKRHREREKATLEKKVAACVPTQLLTHIEMLRRPETRDQDVEESPTHLSQSRATNTACTGDSRRRHRSASPPCKERYNE